jgi:putative FmdB family regulatory protein
MPMYEYVCRECDAPFERYVRAWGEAVQCEKCESPNVEKRLSTFAMSGLSSGSGGGGGCGCGRGGCGCAH